MIGKKHCSYDSQQDLEVKENRTDFTDYPELLTKDCFKSSVPELIRADLNAPGLGSIWNETPFSFTGVSVSVMHFAYIDWISQGVYG